MFDFKQRVFVILAMVVLIAGMVVLTKNKDFSALLSKNPVPPAQSPAQSFIGITGAVVGPSVGMTEIATFGMYLLVLGVLVFGVFQLAAFSSRLDEKDDARQAIVAYIKQAREQGFSHDQIQKRLQDAGWGDSQLEKPLNRVS